MKSAGIPVLVLAFLTNAWSQSFTVDSLASAGVTGTRLSAAAWGDFDNDGDFDFLLAGQDTSNQARSGLFQNDGTGGFVEIAAAVPDVQEGSVTWGDFDSDGDLDLVLTGRDTSGTPIAQVLRNDGSSNFAPMNLTLPGVTQSASAASDFDHNGTLDLVLAGRDGAGQPVTKLFLNQSTGWQEKAAGLTGVESGSISVGDLNNDGSADILLTGKAGENLSIARIYFNDGKGVFSENVASALVGISRSASALGDYDQDGDLDLLLAGVTSLSNTVTRVYRNDGNGVFTDIQAGLIGVALGSAAWGDVDNDGDLDIFLTGLNENHLEAAAIYRNDGQAGFVDITATLAGVSEGSGSFADQDNDGDLDLLITGTDTSGVASAWVYDNTALVPNSPPTVPPALSTTLSKTLLTFAWQPSLDSRTASAGLSYNLRVGTTPGGSDIVSPHAQANGQRSVVAPGNTFQSTSASLPVEVIRAFPKVYWSVQAIDNGFAGSGFAAEQVFTAAFTQDPVGTQDLTGVNASSVDWGDYDSDGDLDLLLTGQDVTNRRIAAIFRNDGNSQFVAVDAGLTGVAASAVAWGDYNSDGHLDIVLTGFTANNVGLASIYKNNGDGSFTDIAANLTAVFQSSVDWGDYDTDGDLDILLSGLAQDNTSISRVFQNDGGVFQDIQAGLIGVSGGTSAWGDYDNDGDPDILVTGTSLSQGNVAKLYRNDGNGVFTDINAGLTGVTSSSAAWGDFDNDGDLDILLSGSSAAGRVTKLFRNDGDGLFTDINAGLAGVSNGALAWGDFDNDGDPDILLSGFDNQFTRIARVYRNEGAAGFTDVNAFLDGVIFGSATWADFDRDSDLDILLTGSSLTSRIAKLYQNNSSVPNSAPRVPAGLAASFTNTSLTFTWQPATDDQTPQAALTYNLRVGTSPGASDIVADLALPTGDRQVVRSGNMGRITAQTFSISHILAHPAIFWSVQTIDQSFAGSAFAAEESFGPQIVSIKDVPNDEGNRVTLKWKASSLDNDVNRLTSYSVWRAIPESPQASPSKNESPTTSIRTVQLDGSPIAWEWLATLPAHRRPTYSYTAATLYDSMATTDGKHFFLVSAHTNDANIFFDSLPDSGFSIDNLAPAPPQNLAGALDGGRLTLSWQRNDEPDLQHYLIYQSSQPDVDPYASQPVAHTRDTVFVDPAAEFDGEAYFVVVAQDSSGNLSLASNEISFQVTDVRAEDGSIPRTFALQQNYPNPFNPSTQIQFSLAQASHVKLDIYNLLGRRVATVVDDRYQAGEHTVAFHAGRLPSGTYFYKIQAGSFVRIRKMLLLK